MTDRISATFERLKNASQGGLVTFMSAGDPDPQTSAAILRGLPKAGADIIELGMPFTDPMADGPAIQESSQRALAAGMTLKGVLSMVADFRKDDAQTPIILMGYYNPIYSMGVDAFLAAAKKAGVDGLIIVDLPPEEDNELCLPSLEAGIAFIRLATPTTDDKRLPSVLKNTSGFVYYVSITGITGAAKGAATDIAASVDRIKSHCNLPVVVGFGLKSAKDVASINKDADAAVVGSALVNTIKASLDANDKATAATVSDALNFVAELAKGKA